jgi:hypothetical protein
MPKLPSFPDRSTGHLYLRYCRSVAARLVLKNIAMHPNLTPDPARPSLSSWLCSTYCARRAGRARPTHRTAPAFAEAYFLSGLLWDTSDPPGTIAAIHSMRAHPHRHSGTRRYRAESTSRSQWRYSSSRTHLRRGRSCKSHCCLLHPVHKRFPCRLRHS